MRGILVPYGTRGIPLWPGHGPDGVKRLCGVDAPLRLKRRLEEVCRRRESMRGKNTGTGYGKRPAARDKKDASLCSAPFRGLAQGGGEGSHAKRDSLPHGVATGRRAGALSHGPSHGKAVRTYPEQVHLPVRYLTAVATGGRGLGRLKVPFLGFKYLSAPFTDEMIMVPERDLLIPRNPVATEPDATFSLRKGVPSSGKPWKSVPPDRIP